MDTQNSFTVFDLLSFGEFDHLNLLKLSCIAGQTGLNNVITDTEVNHPGLALTGFYQNFNSNYIQIFGAEEASFLKTLDEHQAFLVLETFLNKKVPCCIFTKQLDPPPVFLKLANKKGIPLLRTSLTSSELHERLFYILTNILAPSITIHGVLVEVYGIGVLLTGNSGVGKSETALDLIDRGHRLIIDDLVHIKRINSTKLLGGAFKKQEHQHLLEIRGVGIVNVASLFGAKAIKSSQNIDLIIHLETWQQEKNYDRIGSVTFYDEILNIKVPKFVLPVKSGRNIPIIAETICLKYRAERYKQWSSHILNNSVFNNFFYE